MTRLFCFDFIPKDWSIISDHSTLLEGSSVTSTRGFPDNLESWSVAFVTKEGEMVIRDAHGGVPYRR